jgi:hypothetical protein
MKKICMIGAALALFVAGTKAQAQVMTAPVNNERALHFGIEGGVNLNNLYHLQDEFQTSNMLKVGGHGGFIANIGSGRWSLQPGLRYIMKGAQLESSYEDALIQVKSKNKLTFHYIEMPVNIVWHSGSWSSNRFMIGAGGFVSYLANAQDKFKIKTKSKIEGAAPEVINEGQRELPVGDPYDGTNLRNYDAGVGGFIGYQMASGVYVKAGAEASLLDLQKNVSLGKFYERNYNFLFTLGYMFGYKCK